MFDNLSMRDKLLSTAAVPVNILVALALWAAVAGHLGLAILAGVGVAATMVTATLTARSIANRAADIAASAATMASNTLPAVMADLSLPRSLASSPSAGIDTTTPEVLSAHPDDELGQLARALEAVEAEARLMVAQERDAISAGMSSIVGEMARRNLAILDRQIGQIERLRTGEGDPQRLEQLADLDRLAGRLRRASASVLVLSGAEPTPLPGAPTPVADVLRSAMDSIEDPRNVRLVGLEGVEGVTVPAEPASDLAHLLAEVLENANQFSPSGSPVELLAETGEDGSLRVTVVDRGVGLDRRSLAAANAMVADAPEINLSMGQSIGLMVIGRLARRLDAGVHLSASPGSGVTVAVTVPAPVLLGSTSAPTEQTPTGVSRTDTAEALLGRVPAGSAPEPTSPLGRLLGLAADGPSTSADSIPALGGSTTGADLAGWLHDTGRSAWNDRQSSRSRSGADLLAALIGGTGDPGLVDPGLVDPGLVDPGLDERMALPLTPDLLPDPMIRPADTLAEAIPTGTAFDTGVEGLLFGSPGAAVNDDGTTPHTVAAGGDGHEAWTPYAFGSAAGPDSAPESDWESGWEPEPVPVTTGPEAGTEAGTGAGEPEGVRSLISRYRHGLKSPGHRQPPTDPTPDTDEPLFDTTTLTAPPRDS